MHVRKRTYCNSVILFIFMLILSGCGFLSEKKIENPLGWKVERFSAVNQDGKPFTLDNLEGKVWIADFIFTNCTTVCSPMTAHLASIQKQLKEQGIEVSIVSFSVDPKRDTPEVLKAFGEKFSVDFSNWNFLTGYTEEEIKKISEQSFKSALLANQPDGQVGHGTSFFLVDQSGVIVKMYSGTDTSSDEELLRDIKIISE